MIKESKAKAVKSSQKSTGKSSPKKSAKQPAKVKDTTLVAGKPDHTRLAQPKPAKEEKE